VSELSRTGAKILSYSRVGAQLLQANINGMPLLYLSSSSDNAQHTLRGGIPVLFPQFADRGPLKKHGFARDLSWLLLEESYHADGKILVFQLQLQEGDQPDWPHSAKLVLTTQLTPNALKMYLQVRNLGSTQFAWTGGMHPYLHTADLRESQLFGLQGTVVQDRYDPSRTTETKSAITWNGDEFERLYDSQARLRLQTPSHAIELSMTGFDQWMVWNPGATGAQALKDLPDQDWKRFVCIEPVRVSRPSVLRPGEMFEGGLEMVVHADSKTAVS
jgi:glucose-6-phosphate 1-epimerase